MISYIVQIALSMAIMFGGLSGFMVLKGTNSDIALVLAGAAWLCYTMYDFIKWKKRGSYTQRAIFAFNLLIFIIIEFRFLVIYQLYTITHSAVLYKDSEAALILTIVSMGITIYGCIQLLRKRAHGFLVTIISTLLTLLICSGWGIFVSANLNRPRYNFGVFSVYILVPVIIIKVLYFYINNKYPEHFIKRKKSGEKIIKD